MWTAEGNTGTPNAEDTTNTESLHINKIIITFIISGKEL